MVYFHSYQLVYYAKFSLKPKVVREHYMLSHYVDKLFHESAFLPDYPQAHTVTHGY